MTLVLDPASISEDGGASTVTATVAQGVADPFEVAVSAEAESPATTADFTLSENTVLSFAANDTTSSGAVTITAENNDVDAAHKTIIVRGAVSAGARPRAPQPVELTIDDDDDPPVLSLAVVPAEIVEDGGVSYVVVSTATAPSPRTRPSTSRLPAAPKRARTTACRPSSSRCRRVSTRSPPR